MAQKDVSLRLRAKDDASKTVKKVSDSLKAIETDATNAAKGAGKAGTALGGLAADVARLQNEAARLKSFGNIATQLDRSTAAVERSERALKGAQGEFARLAAESNAATAAAARFKSQTEAQAAALSQQKAALAAARAEQSKTNAIVRQAEKDQLALNAARSQRTSGNRASAGVGIEVGAANSSARRSRGAFVEADLANARARQAQINAEVKNYAAAVQTSTKSLKDSEKATRDAGKSQAALADQVERAGNALLASRADAAANWRELEKIDDAAIKASTALGGLAVRQEDIARASARAADQLARTQRALDAYGKFSTGGGEVVNPKTAAALQNQIEVINTIKADWKALEGETRTLAVALNSVSGNATAQVDAFNRMAAASRQAKAEYQSQVAVLDALRARANLPASGLGKVKNDAAGVAALGGLAVRQEDIARASARAADQLARTQRALDAYGKFSTGGGEVVNPKTAAALQNQIEVINTIKADWKALEGETRTLAVALNSVSGNATAQVDAFNRMAAASRQAKAEYQSQVAVLDALRARANLPASGLGKVKNDAAGVAAANHGAATSTANLTNEQRKLAPAATRTAGAMRQAAGSTSLFGGALLKMGSDTRQSLGALQRIRGEVIALTTSYLGFQAAVRGVSQSVTAFQTLEGVQSRLGAIFNQDTGRVAEEVDFLRANADRLGISFSSLADTYSKFAVATSQANFSQEATRDIFLSVAEAGRVNKLSVDQMNGTFKALEQMVSKGTVTAEELRGQLGDRLPGAFSIMANALGKTTAELNKMMENGEVLATQSNLLKFADEMNRRFGPQLATSLDSVSADIGRFQNDIFKAQLALSQGFIPELRNALQSFNAFANSAEGNQVFLELGTMVGRFLVVLAEVPQYFDEIILAGKTFAALKLAGVFVNMVQSAAQARASFVSVGQSMAFIGPQMQQMSLAQRVIGQGFAQTVGAIDNYRARLLASTATTGIASVGTRGFAISLGVLRGAMLATANVARVMWAAIGGIPGIVATGITLALTGWVTGVDNATSALSEHDRQMQALRQSYQNVSDAAGNWFDKVNGVTLSQAIRSTDELRAAYDRARKSLEEYSRLGIYATSDFDPNSTERRQAVALNDLSIAFTEGTMSIEDYTAAVDGIAQNPASPEIKDVADGLLDIITGAEDGAQSLEEMRDTVAQSEAKLRQMNGTATEADKVLLGLGGAVEETNAAFDKSSAVDTYTAAIDTLKGAIPELAEEMKRLKEMTDLNKAAWEGMTAAFQAGDYGKIGEIVGLWARAAGAVAGAGMDSEIAALGSGAAATSNLIKQFEGRIETPKWDVNAYRAGYGSDTVTLADGSVKQIVQGMTVTLADAERDLARRIVEFQNTVKGQIGEDRFASFNDSQQAVLTSIAYNYGSLPDRILTAVRSGDAGAISAAIRGLSGDNEGVNATRRNKEALIFERGGNADAGAMIEAEAERLKLREEESQATRDRIAQTNFEIAQQKLINDGKAKQAAIEEAVRAAKEENPNIGEAELNTIREQTAALYDQQNARAGLEAAEERVNQLYQLRQQLLDQQKMAEENGDTSKVAAIKEQITGLNSQITEAIQNAITMWTAIGGPEADAAIAKLNTMGMSLQSNSQKIIAFGLNASQIQTLVGSAVDGIVGIFDKLAQAIAEGENAIQAMATAFLQFAADFLRQIAIMILKQMLLNALAAFGGPVGQAAAGLGGIAGHTGGLVGSNSIGSGNPMGGRPAWAQSAFTYHSGGLAGFKPDEVSATLKRNEEVLTEEDPRHRFNMGGGKEPGGGSRGIKQILVMNEAELANAMSSSAGEEVIITTLKRNASTLRQILK